MLADGLRQGNSIAELSDLARISFPTNPQSTPAPFHFAEEDYLLFSNYRDLPPPPKEGRIRQSGFQSNLNRRGKLARVRGLE